MRPRFGVTRGVGCHRRDRSLGLGVEHDLPLEKVGRERARLVAIDQNSLDFAVIGRGPAHLHAAIGGSDHRT